MKVSIVPYSDIKIVRRAARLTAGKPDNGKPPTLQQWADMLRAEESPIRAYWLYVEIEAMPYWVACQLTRHKIGVEWFLGSQRPERRNDPAYDRGAARQDTPIPVGFVANAQALISISRKRLCGKASPETRAVWAAVKRAMSNAEDTYVCEISYYMEADCNYRNWCGQRKPCGLGIYAHEGRES